MTRVLGRWPPAQRLAYHRLAHAPAIKHSGIDEGAAGINRRTSVCTPNSSVKPPTFDIHFDDRVVLRRHADESRANPDKWALAIRYAPAAWYALYGSLLYAVAFNSRR